MERITDSSTERVPSEVEGPRNDNRENKMPDVDLAIRHPALQSIVQQRLNCALPSFFFELWFLSIPKSSRHVREVIN